MIILNVRILLLLWPISNSYFGDCPQSLLLILSELKRVYLLLFFPEILKNHRFCNDLGGIEVN